MELVLNNNFMEMNEQEMIEVDGGSVSLLILTIAAGVSSFGAIAAYFGATKATIGAVGTVGGVIRCGCWKRWSNK